MSVSPKMLLHFGYRKRKLMASTSAFDKRNRPRIFEASAAGNIICRAPEILLCPSSWPLALRVMNQRKYVKIIIWKSPPLAEAAIIISAASIPREAGMHMRSSIGPFRLAKNMRGTWRIALFHHLRKYSGIVKKKHSGLRQNGKSARCRAASRHRKVRA